jgi:tetratricopeptide (TPR) repeat protein
MIDAVHRYDGYIVQSTGDGIFALFGAPVAHEDHPQRALYAALRVQDEMRRYSTRLREAGNAPIEARVGINTGEAVVRSIKTGDGHTEYTPIGHSTSLASRMQTLAPTGSIAVTETTEKLCAGYFNFKALGPTRVKGVSDPVNVFEVIGLGLLRTRLQRSAGRGLTKFVGREREIDAMKHAAEQACAGHGQIVAAMADPGVGKSRLFYEFKLRNQSGWLVLEAFSVSHAKASAYVPVFELLHSYFDIKPEDDARRRREKVNGKVLTLDRSLEDALPYLFALLGIAEGDDSLVQMETQLRRRRTHEAVKRILLRESLNQPLMLIFEDLHWIDDETQGLLNLLADSIGTCKTILLVNYRPEYKHQWGSKTYYTQLRLDPLGTASADEMLTSLLGNDATLAPLKRLIAERTEGNPLFMEEIYLGLFEDGALARNGSVKLLKPLDSLRIPPTVQGILAARIDRLPASEKDLLQTLAVIGKEFPLALAREVIKRADDELNLMIEHLQLAEFIYEQPTPGDIEYTFKHALTHEVAYGSLLIERRRRLHERAGAAMESLFAEGLDDHATELARHFAQSANALKATQYLALAGKRSLERADSVEAQAHLRQGLEWAGRIADPTQRAKMELKLRIVLGEAFMYVKGPSSREAKEETHRAEELAQQVGSDIERFSVLMMLRNVMMFGGMNFAAIDKARLGYEIAERIGDPEMIATACASLAAPLWIAGQLTEALQMARRSVEAGRPPLELRKFAYYVDAEQVGAFVLLMLGYPDQAVRANRESLEAFFPRSQGRYLGPAMNAAVRSSFFYIPLQRPDTLRELLEPALYAAEQAGLLFESARARAFLGWAIARSGNPDEGIAMIRRGLEDTESTGTPKTLVLSMTLPDALVSASRYTEALAVLDEALRDPHFGLLRVTSPELHRLKGKAVLGHDASATDEAETCFREAIEIARQQSAKWWELRATTSLARLLRDTNRRDEARATLADIYNWFTEGFETRDLIDAKALLEELGS